MKPHPTILTLLFTPGLLGAQDPTHTGLEVVPHPSETSGDFHPSEVSIGDFDNDGTADIVVTSDGRAGVQLWVADHATHEYVPRPDGAGDLAVHRALALRDGVLPGVPVPVGGPRDGVMAVGPDGLTLMRLDEHGVWQAELEVGGAWTGALDLVLADWNGDGLDDAVGLAASGMEALLHLRSADGGWTAGTSISLGLTATEIVPLIWDDPAIDVELELATTGPAGVTVYDGDGAPLYVRTSPLAPGRIARVHGGTEDVDQLAWVVGPTNSGVSVLVQIARGGTEVGNLVLPDFAPDALDAGDVDGDGDTDLYLTQEDDYETLLLEHLGDTPSFDLATGGFWLDTENGLSPGGLYGNRAACFGDVDLDGAVDLAVVSEANIGTILFHGPLGGALIGANVPVRQFVKGTSQICQNSVGDGYLYVDLEYQALPLDTEYFETVTWQQDDYLTAVQEVAISNCKTIVLPSAGSMYGFRANLPPPIASGLPTPGDWENDVRAFHFLVRPLDGEFRPIGPSVVGTFSMDGHALAEVPLGEGWEHWDEHTTVTDDCDNIPSGSTPVGGFAHARRIPPMGPGKRPKFDAPCKPATKQ